MILIAAVVVASLLVPSSIAAAAEPSVMRVTVVPSAGQMSLVGPRPERPEFLGRLVEQVPFYTHRGIVKPGITGWAQVRCGYAGSEVGTAWKLSHDLYYLKRRSVLFDLLIMIETLRIVVSGRQFGAELRADFVLPQAVIQPLQRESATDQRVGGRPDDAC